MVEAVESKPPFNPPAFKCASCDDIIQSSYPGEYVQCKCGEIAVDSTEYYTRCIGDYKMFIPIPNDKPTL